MRALVLSSALMVGIAAFAGAASSRTGESHPGGQHPMTTGMKPVAAAPGEKPYANVRVIPAGTPRAETSALMKHFASSLGVRCSTCHVGEEGKPLSTYDFASDAKEEKRMARFMMEVTRDINAKMGGKDGAPSVTDMAKNRVTCTTCHRGERHPLTAMPKPQ